MNKAKSHKSYPALRLYTAVLDHLDEGVTIATEDGVILYANSADEATFGCMRSELIGKQVASFMAQTPKEAKLLLGKIKKKHSTGETWSGEIRCLRGDGTTFLSRAKISSIQIDGAGYWVCVKEDVTGKKRLIRRQAITRAVDNFLVSSPASEEIFPAILKIMCTRLKWAFGAVWTIDSRIGQLRCQSTWSAAPQTTRDYEAATRTAALTPGIGLPGQAWQAHGPHWNQDIATGGKYPRSEAAAKSRLHGSLAFPIMLENRVLCVIEIVSSEVEEPDQQLLATCAQISTRVGEYLQRKQFEEALRRSEARYGEIVEEAQEGIWVLNDAGVTTYANPAMFRILGYDYSEMIGRPIEDFLFEEDRHDVAVKFERRKKGIAEKFERRLRHKSGSEVFCIISSRPVMGSSGKMISIIALVSDITESKIKERLIADQQTKMIAVSKMSALGEMAGGIAHEVNTPLGIICMKTAQLKMRVQEKRIDRPKIIEVIESIESTSFRIARIIKGLRAFAREGATDPFQQVSLKTIVEDTLVFCSERFKDHNIKLELPDISEALLIECSPTQVSQVLLNLLNNACDAVIDLGNKWIRIDVRDAGETVELAVADSGPGIPPEMREKIMQPFFTSKAVGKGTGLGLGISKGIIESHSGTLFLDASCPNTRFVIVLPKRQNDLLRMAA
ncbi:MAG: PAS domain S-box protein [Deltaproteobacteria bacterium]|nr:PAS domain S-box protein [Deltaproteobacteria bacterium]